MREIFEKFKFEAEIEKLDEANRLFEVVKEFARVDLHPDRIPNLAMGYVFEDLIRRFNEQANEEAGDHFTPREVIRLMVNLLYTGDEDVYKPGIVRTIYDPACGTGGMLSVSEKYIRDLNADANLKLFGQDYNAEVLGHLQLRHAHQGRGPTTSSSATRSATARPRDGFAGKTFHYMLANPPFGVEWKDTAKVVEKEHADARLRRPLRRRAAAHQ